MDIVKRGTAIRLALCAVLLPLGVFLFMEVEPLVGAIVFVAGWIALGSAVVGDMRIPPGVHTTDATAGYGPGSDTAP